MSRRKQISPLNRFRCQTWLNDHRELIKDYTIYDATAAMNKDLDLNVSRETIRTWVNVLDITFIKKSRSQSMERIAVTERRIKTICIAIKELYEDMGSKQHPGIITILEDYYTKEG